RIPLTESRGARRTPPLLITGSRCQSAWADPPATARVVRATVFGGCPAPGRSCWRGAPPAGSRAAAPKWPADLVTAFCVFEQQLLVGVEFLVTHRGNPGLGEIDLRLDRDGLSRLFFPR